MPALRDVVRISMMQILHDDYKDCNAHCPSRERHIATVLTQLDNRITVLTGVLHEALITLQSHHDEYPCHGILARVHHALEPVDGRIVIRETTAEHRGDATTASLDDRQGHLARISYPRLPPMPSLLPDDEWRTL
jgi:hypothetical protein